MELINGDCLIELKKIPDSSVDFVYLDLPYGQTACKWDVKIDLEKLWKQLKRIAKNDRTPFFFSCTTKFGYDLIGANPKWFRWDLVWEKNRAAGFLNAYKLPMRKHEMIYCFAKKSPEYDVSSHLTGKTTFGNSSNDVYLKEVHLRGSKESYYDKDHIKKETKDPLPTSVLPPTDDHELIYCFAKKTPEYDVSSHIKDGLNDNQYERPIRGYCYGLDKSNVIKPKSYKNTLPTSIIPSSWCKFNLDNRTGHRTAKPVKLMEFLLKYWSKPGDTVLDPTAGSGSMGIACKQMDRKFIGIEKDPLIYELMKERIDKSDTPREEENIK
jgi:DNA modification methylase